MASSFLINGMLGLLPVIVFLAILIQLDAFKLVRFGFVLRLVAAGAGAALISYIVGRVIIEQFGVAADDFTRFLGPVLEEIMKALIVVILIRTYRIGFALDAIIAGFAIGAGFAILENYFYLRVIGDENAATWVVRGFGAAIMHGGATSIFAVLTILLTPQDRTGNILRVLIGIAAAIAVHVAFNHFRAYPVMSTVVTMSSLTLVLAFAVMRSQQSLDKLLEVDFPYYRQLLDELQTGALGKHPIGKTLASLKTRLAPSETAEIIEYVTLHTKLVLFGEEILAAQAKGDEIKISDATRDNLARFHYLDERLGSMVRLLLKGQLRFSRKEFFQLYKLGRDAGKKAAIEHNFNSDILFDVADQEVAKKEFPDIFFALDHQALRDAFTPFDNRANKSKKNSKRWGMWAILLLLISLLVASGEPLYISIPELYLKLISVVASVVITISVVIGVFGINYRSRKMRWLADRLATEQIRQTHFNFYISNFTSILKGASNEGALQAFLNKREANLQHFQATFLDHIDENLHRVLSEDEFDHDEYVANMPEEASTDNAAVRQYFSAYEHLRFIPQLNYCNHVLRESKSFWRPSTVRQSQLMGAFSVYGLIGVVIFQQLVLIGVIADIAWMKSPFIHVLTAWAALLSLFARTFQEGFQPQRELERMRQYRLALRRIYARFRNAASIDAKIDAMREMEKMSYEEMLLFLKSNYEAEFIM